MRLPLLRPGEQTAVDMETAKQMFDTYLAAGYTYLIPHILSRGKERGGLARACCQTLSARGVHVHRQAPESCQARARSRCRPSLTSSLRAAGVEYFDYYWLHSVTGANIENVERIGAFVS